MRHARRYEGGRFEVILAEYSKYSGLAFTRMLRLSIRFASKDLLLNGGAGEIQTQDWPWEATHGPKRK